MVKLTEGIVSQFHAQPGQDEDCLWDDLPGFGVRAYASGKKSYIVHFRIGRQKQKVTLGRATPGRLTEMRKLAGEMLAKAKLGQDPSAHRKEAFAKKGVTIGSLVEPYIEERMLQLKVRAMEGIVLHLRTHWKPLHGRLVDKIGRQDIVGVMDGIAQERGRTASDRAKTSISGFFAWCLDRGYCPANPCLGIRRRGANPSRERVLTLEELGDVWRACPQGDYGKIVKLLLLTGSRRNEIANLQWDEISFEGRGITIPAARTKNRLIHLVPMSEQVEAIICGMERIAGRDFVFGEGPSAGYQAWSRAKRTLDAAINEARSAREEKPISQWQLHDLRRSFVTHMAEQKLALPHIIESCVNHQSGHKGGVAGVYNRALYADEKRAAFQAWGSFLARLVEQVH
jgi:integrase